MDSTQSPLLTTREAARFLRIGRTRLWELTRSGEIPAYRVGRGRNSPLRFKRVELLAWLETRRISAGAARQPATRKTTAAGRLPAPAPS